MLNNRFVMGGGTPETRHKERQSNFELLRIIAMSMILIHHFLVHGITRETLGPYLYGLLNGFVYTGVNLFFMISGRFTIRLSVKSFLKLLVLVLGFQSLNLLLLVVSGENIGLSNLTKTIIFPFSYGSYWFIRIYYCLMLFCPIINSGLNSLKSRHLTLIVALLTLAISYSNFVSEEGHHHLYQALYFYVLGYWIGKHPLLKIPSKTLIAIVCLSCLLWGIFYPYYPEYIHRYSNIFMIIAPLGLMMLFARYKFQSRMINIISASALGCYLFQDGWWGNSFLYPWQHGFVINNPMDKIVIMFVISFCLIWLISILFTTILTYVSRKLDIYASLLDAKCRCFLEKF